MPNILSYWKLLLTGGMAVVIIILAAYLGHVKSNLRKVELERDQIKVQSQQQMAYISRYEQAKAEQEKLVAELQDQIQQIPENPACHASVAFTNIIGQLH